MAVSGKEKGKGKVEDLDEERKVARDKGKKAVLDKGKNVVRDDDEEEQYENEEYVVDEAEEDGSRDSSGEDIKVTRKKRHKRFKERFELDEDDYDLLDDADVTGFRRPANLGGKFKRLRKAGHVSGIKDSGTVPEEISEEEESEEDEEEIVDDVSEDEVGEYELLSKSQKKGGRQAQRTSTKSRRGVQKVDRSYKPPLGGRKRFDREALAALNAEGVDSDDDDGNDQETLSRRLLEKQFEPSLLEVNYITARDDRLRRTDIPERLQILEETADALPSSDLELRQAAEWIFDRAFGDLCVPSRPEFQHLLTLGKPEVVRQIANVLHLVHNEKLEVPFIGLYRREECLDLSKEPTDEFQSFDEGPTIQQYKALWAVQEWNKKWLLLQRRKSDLHVSFKERIPVDVSSIPEKDKIVQNVFRFLEDAESEQATDDCQAQFNLHFPVDASEVADCGFKRPRVRSLYSIGHQAGLGEITKHFGLTSEAFGDNVKAGYKRNEILDEVFLPEDLAAKDSLANTSKAEFRDPASLIRGARHMLAMEISTEPLVREYVRAFYSKNARVTTRPTLDAIDAIDAFHQFEGVKWISGKLISAFDDEQWLLIQKSEEEKLIDVTLGLSKESIDTILFDCEQLFSSDGLSRTSKTWNEQRKQILQEAIVVLLLPIMEKEARMSLVVRAKQVLVAKCGLQLWNKVSVAPPKAANSDCRNEDGPALRVLACCWGPPSTGTAFVMLDADGEILNIMHTGYLNIKAITPEQSQRKENDQARLMQVLIEYKPHFIVLGAARVQCRYLSQDIADVLFKVVEQHAGDLAEGLDSTKLVYGDESIPSLFEASRISQKQLPGMLGAVRRAVALGRFLQNPVAMVASLCGPTMEVLSIKFHPLQSFLSKEELYDIIERVMVTVVNQIGIDINLAAMHDWLFETLQFVGGLGPRKAEVIRRTLQMEGRVLTRNDLYSTVRAMDEKVFTNSAGFIRVRGIGQSSSDLYHSEPLDNTRIHPEWYQMTKNLAEAAIEKEAKRNNEEVDDDLLKMAVEHVMKNPNVLDSVDIEEYAQAIQVEGRSKRMKTLDLIKSELQRGFQEWRKPYSEPSQEDCFYLMTGESEETLFQGRIVQATVRKVQEHQVMCVLECGLVGFIQKEDLSDDGDVEPKDKFTEGSPVICRVKEVKKDKYLVDLTCKESDLRGDSRGDLHHGDKHFKPDITFLLNEQEKTRKKKEDRNKKTFKTRPIVHPKFQNLFTDDAIKVLAEKDMGDFIIHPSSKGPAHLSITLKLSDGLFSHIDIAESGKENWDLASFLRLGKTLTIGDDSYKNLDEVISKYVNQIVTHLNAILQYRKYKQGNKSEIADALRSEKTEKPKCIPYCISLAHEYPGAFMLSYIRATNPYHEYISLVPSGFRFRKKVFDTIDKLVVYFQSHFHDPIPEASNRGKGGRGRGRGRGDRDNGSGEGDERPRGVCYAFQRGDCPNGDRCKFSHEKDERPRGVCYAFQRGDCPNGDDCKFSHEKPDREVCRAFQRGDCSRGDGCRFAHDKQDDKPREVCRAFQRGDCSRGDGCRFAHDEQENTDTRRGGGGAGGADWTNTSTTNSNVGGHDWNSGAGNDNWGDDRGTTSDTKGRDSWNDAADGGAGSAWEDKGGIACTAEEEADGWKDATNAAGGGGAGGAGGWDNWNDSADGKGGAPTNAANEGGGWDSCNDPADGVGSAAANAASRGGDWDIGESVKAKGEDATKFSGGDSAWEGRTKSIGRGDEGWGSVPASDGGSDGHDVEGGHAPEGDDDVSGSKFSHEKQDERPRGVCYAFQRGDCPNGDNCRFSHEKQDERPRGVCYAFQRGDCPNGDNCRFSHEKQDERPRGVCYAFQRGDCPNGDNCRFSHEKQDERPRGVCYAFQRGDCPNGDNCRFLHEKQDERPRGVCYAFQRGDCLNGDNCRFLHEKQDERSRGVCYAFQRGDCSRGDGCRFAHDKQDDKPREVCRAFQRGGCSRGDGCRFAHDEQKNTNTGSEKGRWNENAGGGGEKTKRWGSDLCPPSPAKRPAYNNWGNRESTPAVDGVGSSQNEGKSESNIATTNDAWGSATNSAGGGGDGWDTVPASESDGWDALQSGDKGGFNSRGGADENRNQIGREGLSNRRGCDQVVARRQEGSSDWGSDLPPTAPSDIPVQDSWGGQSEPPGSTDDGWGQSAGKGHDATRNSGLDEPVDKETELAGPDWGALDAVADTWGSVGGGDNTGRWGQHDAAAGNDGWDRQPLHRDQGQWGSRGGRGSQNDGGRWEGQGGRGSRNDSRHNSSDWD